MPAEFSRDIYGSWKGKQLEKYRALLPLLRKQLRDGGTLLDIGIGHGWFEEFLRGEGFRFSRVVGVDVDEKSVEPRLDGVEYVLDPDYRTAEKFDFVVCFDAAHLLRSPGRLIGYSRRSVLVSLPRRMAEALEAFPEEKIIKSGIIGEQEKDCFIFLNV